MRTAGSFLTILGGGVLIVMIYLWSGESTIVLVMSILTLFAAVVLYEWRPWSEDNASPLFARTDGSPDSKRWAQEENLLQGEPTGQLASVDNPQLRHQHQPQGEAQAPPPGGDQSETVWRSRFDIIWDDDDLAGLALGDSEPTSRPWSTVHDVGLGVCQAIAQGDLVEERLCLVLTPTDDAGSEAGAETQLMFGPDQDPELVADNAIAAFRASWVTHSPLHALTAAERTRKLVDALSANPVSLRRETRSPELLYQELRRVLLTNRVLRRLSAESQPADVIAALEALLGAHQLPRLTRTEAADLAEIPGAAGGDGHDGSDHDLGDVLDHIAVQRGRRLVSIGTEDGDDYLLGLIPADTARHWDGQPVGSGLITVRVLPLG